MDIQNNFTVAGGTPVTGEDLQKVQDQIISPTQDLYINAKIGSDETGDGTSVKPYKTIERAMEERKVNTPSLRLHLYVETGNESYWINPVDFHGYTQQDFQIIAYPWTAINNKKRPILFVNYGKIFAEDYTGTTKYHWGNILCGNVERIYIAGINVKLSNPYTGTNYSTFLCETDYLDVLQSIFEIGSYSLMKCNSEIEQKIRFREGSLPEGNTGYIVNTIDAYNVFAEDPSIQTENLGISTLAVSVNNSACQISSSFYRAANITQDVLSNGNSGYSTNIDITYKNWS